MDVAHNYTVMYTGLPKDTLRQVYPLDFFNQYFPGEVVDAQVGVEADGLRKLVKEWEANEEKLRFARAALEEKGTRSTKRTFPIFGTKMDEIDFYEAKLADLARQIEAKRATVSTPCLFSFPRLSYLTKKGRSPPQIRFDIVSLIAHTEISHVGFVTFRSIGIAYQNSQLLMDKHAPTLHAHPAPEPVCLRIAFTTKFDNQHPLDF